MIDSLVLDGTVTLFALAVLAIELVVIVLLAARRRKAPSAYLVSNLLSGLFLILALRASLLAWGAGAIALFLALAGAAHVGEVLTRRRLS